MKKLLAAFVVCVASASTGCATAGQHRATDKEDMELVCTKGRATGSNVKAYSCRWRESAVAERESSQMTMHRWQQENHQVVR